MHKELPGFDNIPKLTKKCVKAFDLGAFGVTKARTGHVSY